MNCLMTAWHAHEAELRGWLRHRLGSAVDAEDLLQEVFLKAAADSGRPGRGGKASARMPAGGDG